MVKLAETLAEEKKARDTVVLEIGRVSLVADYFLMTEGANKLQVQAIADHIMQNLKAAGYPLLHKEGYQEGLWILLDYGSVVIHIFQPEERRFYNLERLWGHAPRLSGVSTGL
jgi:ribosome-associated protein